MSTRITRAVRVYVALVLAVIWGIGEVAAKPPQLKGRLARSPKGQQCAMEGQTCSFQGQAVVYYGHGQRWVMRRLQGPVACNNQTFGDPVVGTKKRCMVDAASRPTLKGPVVGSAKGRECAKEGKTCAFDGQHDVFYGYGTRWVRLRLKGPAACNNQTFGDPVPGTRKSCRVDAPPPLKGELVGAPQGRRCASERETCSYAGEAEIYYGHGNRWVKRKMKGPVGCNNKTFGDPVVGTVKSCHVHGEQSDGREYDVEQVAVSGISEAKTHALVQWAIKETMRQEQPVCWKKSKPNTAGRPLKQCPPGKEKSGGLCYPPCKAGYRSDGATRCYRNCPSGTKYSPGFCYFKFGSVGKCPKGLKGAKPACMNTDAYQRGAGTVPGCGAGEVKKGLLCYPQCPDGWDHGGPVCWMGCGDAHPTNCGAMCGHNAGKCVGEVANMVLATGELVANIAGAVLTGGAANAGMKAAKTAAKTGSKVAAKIALKQALKAARKKLAKKMQRRLGARVMAYATKKSGRKAGRKLAQDYAQMVLERAAQKIALAQANQDPDLREIIAMVDPTGVAEVVNAFTKPLCAPIPMPH